MLGHGERQKLNSNGYSTRLCMENFKIEPEPLCCFPGKEHITFLLPGEKNGSYQNFQGILKNSEA